MTAKEVTECETEEIKEAEEAGEFELNSVAGSILYLVVLSLVVPAIVGFVTDAFHLQFLSEKDLGVLSLTNSFDTITTIVPLIFPIGAQIVLSKSLGRGDRDELSANYTTIVLGLSVLVVILAAAMIVFRHPIVSLLGADEALDYEQGGVMVVVFFALGMIPLSLKNLLCILFYMEDESRRGILYAVLAGSAVNILGYICVTAAGPSLFGYLMAGFLSDLLTVVLLIAYKRWKSCIYRFPILWKP